MACLNAKIMGELSPDTKMLEIGCGPKRVRQNSVTLDLNPKSCADVIHDLNSFPYPFPENTFDCVLAEHVLEHVDNLIRVIEELHRITKPGGLILVEVPHYSSRDFYTDPTHNHAFSVTSFDYFVPALGGLFLFRYSDTARFKVRRAELSGPSNKWWQRIVNHYARKNPIRFEREWAFIFPREHINFELVVLKGEQAEVEAKANV
jgi:SAM-dependent methyltransferase